MKSDIQEKVIKPSSHGTNPPLLLLSAPGWPTRAPALGFGSYTGEYGAGGTWEGPLQRRRALEWKLQKGISFAHHESQKGPETHLQNQSARSQTTGISDGSVHESTGGAVLYPSPLSYKPGKRSESITSRPGIEIHSPSSKDRPSSKFWAQKKIVQLDS